MSARMELDQTNEVDESSNNNLKNNNNSQLLDASNPEVLEKYKTAGIISNSALHKVLSSCRPGMKIVDLCRIGDEFIVAESLKVYQNLNGAKGQKGICFPTCVSVNEVAGHNSLLSDDKRRLHLGDMIKVDLGTHIDGFCAVVAHTIVLGECKGKKADVIASAWSAAQSALRLLKIGNKNAQVTLGIEKSANIFNCTPMDSVLSHEMRQYVIDYDNTIISAESAERKVAQFEFSSHQVFGIDIIMSSGRGKAVDRGERCTIYKRNVEVEYPLKMKTSRELLKQINKKYPTFPFSMRNFEANRSRLGITECLRTNIVQPYPILSEKNGEFVAQFKFTVILNPNATIQVTGLPLDMANVHPSKQINDSDEGDQELNNLLSTKFDGILPVFYEKIKMPHFDKVVLEGKDKGNDQGKKRKPNQQKKKKKSGGNKGGNQNKYRSNKNKKNNQNKRKNQQNNRNNKKNQQNRNKNQQNKNNNNQNRNQNQPQQQAMIMDLD